MKLILPSLYANRMPVFGKTRPDTLINIKPLKYHELS